jgi:concanavalin A-like lectin/glucanase superfamily protein/putative pyrroloquinoline-quinone binding quinoprotein
MLTKHWPVTAGLLTLGLVVVLFLAAPAEAEQITLRAATSAAVESGVLTLTITKPTGTVQNDVMITSIAIRPNTATITLLAGWTLVQRVNNTNATASSLAVYRRVAGGSEPGSYAWTLGGSPTGAAGGIQAFSGVDTTTPIDAQNGAFTTVATTTPATPSINTTVVNTMLVTSHSIPNRNLWAATPPTWGGTQGFQVRPGTAPLMIQGSWARQPAIGATLTKTATDVGGDAADFGNAHILALRPCAPVSDATYVAANAQNGQVTVYWSSANPVVILRKTSAFGTETPNAPGTATQEYSGSAASFTQTSPAVANGTTYYYKVFVSPCYSPGIAINATPKTGAGAPVWSYATLATSLAAPGIDPNDVVLAGSNDNKLHGMNASDGTLAFAPFATGGAIQARPAVIPADYSAYDTLTGLAYWRLDEGTGTVAADASGNGNTGTLINAPVWTAGVRGNALSFNGTNQYVSVPHTATLNNWPITVTAWFKTASTTGSPGIVNKYVSASLNGWQLFMYNGGLCAWYLINSSVYINNDAFGNCNPGPNGIPGLNNNTWHHAAIVVDASGGTLYVDGALQGTVAWTGNPTGLQPSTTQPINIGRYGTGYFPGLIDDVRIYNRALSAAEVLGVYRGLNIAYVPSQDVVPPNDAVVYAINTSTGAQVWKSPSLAAVNEIRGGASVWLRSIKALTICGANTDAVFVGTFIGSSDVNKVYALNGGNTPVTTTGGGNCTSATVNPGGILWSFTGVAGANALRVIYATPYVDYANDALWVTSHATGTTTPSVWKFNVTNGTRVVPSPSTLWNLDDISASPTPSSDGTFMYVGTLLGTLSAIRLSDGAVFNCTPPACGGSTGTGEIKGLPWPLGGSPEEIVFTRDTTIHKVSFNTATATFNPIGSTPWTIQLTGTPNVSAPVDDFAGNIYVGTSLGKVHRIRVSDGADVGQVTITASPTPTVGDPAFDGVLNQIYVGATDGHIYTFSPGF